MFQTEDGDPFTADQREQIGKALTEAEESPGVDGVLDPFAAQDEREAQEQQLADGREQAADGRAQLDAADAARVRAAELKAEGARNKEIAKTIAVEFGLPRNAAYEIALDA